MKPQFKDLPLYQRVLVGASFILFPLYVIGWIYGYCREIFLAGMEDFQDWDDSWD